MLGSQKSETEERRTRDLKRKKINKINGRKNDMQKSKGKKWKEGYYENAIGTERKILVGESLKKKTC